MDDFLEVGQLLMLRLREHFPDLKVSPWLSDLSSLTGKNSPVNDIYVVYQGMGEVMDEDLDGRKASIEQSWCVVLVFWCGESRGERINQVREIIQGWSPRNDFECFSIRPSPRMVSRNSGVTYFPLLFSTSSLFLSKE